jgi:hypothetical protein
VQFYEKVNGISRLDFRSGSKMWGRIQEVALLNRSIAAIVGTTAYPLPLNTH